MMDQGILMRCDFCDGYEAGLEPTTGPTAVGHAHGRHNCVRCQTTMLGQDGDHGAANVLCLDLHLQSVLASEIVVPADLLAQASVFHSFSQTLSDAAGEFQCRIEMGEFDDLDDMQLGDLRTLGQRMAQWAAFAKVIEARGCGSSATGANSKVPTALSPGQKHSH